MNSFLPAMTQMYTRAYCGHGNSHMNGLCSTLFPPAVTSPTNHPPPRPPPQNPERNLPQWL